MKLAFACPYYGPTQPLIHLTHWAAPMNAAQEGHVWEDNYSQYGLQHRYACEVIAKKAVEDERIDAVFWTEHDVALPGNAVQSLIKAMEETPDADVVSGIVFRRCEPYNPMISLHATLTREEWERMQADAKSGKLKDERLLLALRVLSYEEMARDMLAPLRDLDTSQPPFPIKACSMCCFLVKREALKKVIDIPDLFAVDPWGLYSIDTAFSLKLHHAGLKAYCQPAVMCGHRDDNGEIITVNHYQRYLMKLVEKGEAERTEAIRKAHPEARIYGELTRLADKYKTDKGSLDHLPGSGWEGWIHNYTPFYEAVLAPIRLTAKRVLEIGVFQGASLKMWRDYFPNATVYGIDNWSLELDAVPKPTDLGDRIVLQQADQADRTQLAAAVGSFAFDMICDDGGHMMDQQQISLGFLFPLMRPGGVYILEDLHTSAMGEEYGVKPDGSNSTLHFLEALQEGRDCPSEYMTPVEYGYLRAHVDSVMIHGKKSLTAVIRKKAA